MDLATLIPLLTICVALTIGATEAIKKATGLKSGLAVILSAVFSILVCISVCFIEELGIKVCMVLSVLTFLEANGVYALTMHVAKKVGTR